MSPRNGGLGGPWTALSLEEEREVGDLAERVYAVLRRVLGVGDVASLLHNPFFLEDARVLGDAEVLGDERLGAVLRCEMVARYAGDIECEKGLCRLQGLMPSFVI